MIFAGQGMKSFGNIRMAFKVFGAGYGSFRSLRRGTRQLAFFSRRKLSRKATECFRLPKLR